MLPDFYIIFFYFQKPRANVSNFFAMWKTIAAYIVFLMRLVEKCKLYPNTRSYTASAAVRHLNAKPTRTPNVSAPRYS